jgi:hypothetical protein
LKGLEEIAGDLDYGFDRTLRIGHSGKTLGISTKEKLGRLTEWLKKPLIPGEAGSIKWKSDIFRT